MKAVISVSLIFLVLGCNSTPRDFSPPKVKYLAVTKHPEKGRIVSEHGKEQTKNELYDLDFKKCSELTYKKGVKIGSKISTDKDEIIVFLERASSLNARDTVFKGVKSDLNFTNTEKELLKEYNKFNKNRWSCMQKIGWSSVIEEVPFDK
ncbi:hypothetical protein J7384_18560 [Endozoicomonas sp. G2_1]|uniref:hypothetical protein n=1 Tax=Endozoicomonas sp. G2_1 TaxID=2821091 RepID=UPI001ADAC3B2|nr:hypothetical protein [Endozoicomonas sp. G2_1]MBO9492371.1 hypothetical protein [Endozoicomonas sp. G2_1]